MESTINSRNYFISLKPGSDETLIMMILELQLVMIMMILLKNFLNHLFKNMKKIYKIK